MSKHRELELLKKQEATLLQLRMTFSDQLNRLKVEELALTNLLRLQQEKDNKDDTKVSEGDGASQMVKNDLEENSVAVLDLAVGQPHNEEEEEDSEEEGYNYKDQLTTFLEDLLTQQKQEASERMGGVEDGEEET